MDYDFRVLLMAFEVDGSSRALAINFACVLELPDGRTDRTEGRVFVPDEDRHLTLQDVTEEVMLGWIAKGFNPFAQAEAMLARVNTQIISLQEPVDGPANPE